MNVVRNYLYNAGYQLLTLIVPFITVPYIARVLGPEGVGINSYTNSIITYFLLLGTLGITVYGNREIAYHRDNFEQRTKTFWEIELLQVMTVVVAYGLFLVFVLFQTTYRGYFLLQSLWIVAGVFDISWLFMGMEDFKKTVLRNSLVKIASLVAIFTLVKSQADVGTYIMILGLAQVLGNLTLWPYLHTVVGKPRIDFSGILSHLKPTIVLFIPQIATQVYLQLNRTMLGQFDSVTSAGYYDFADKLVKMVLAVITATGTVMLPHMSHLAAQGSLRRLNRLLYKSFSFSSLLALPLMFGLAATANSLVPLYYGPKFSIVSQLIMIEAPVALLIGWSNVIGLQYLMPLKRVKDYTASVTYGALANIVINVPLILTLGVSGATIATVVSEVVVTAYQLFVIRDMVSYRNLFADGWKFLLAAVAMFIPVFWLNSTMSVSAISLALQVTLGIGIYFGILSILKPDILREGLYYLKSRQK
ncbi:polysaccharide biosynthesis protein [Levilactobacillus koreensis JCM 16448]|uniref:Flippase n=1 Tax=Levilactobacillus koreensis TaxID=637971 RepID=A0AAC8ZHF0_9LACO|nr:flippase [Levilactobacillus koreensis]AKP65322.1 flippase [Levilactobacillus koreensis]KRK86095.1 polysaccharide biosynthesis protein [Levilactobacillus koreensis JCM 16448]